MRRHRAHCGVAGLALGWLAGFSPCFATELGPALMDLPTESEAAAMLTEARAIRAGGGGIPLGDKALIIGINDYEGTENDLHGAVADAMAVEKLLVTSLGWDSSNILSLYDTKATGKNIVAALKLLLIDSTRPGDQVFFYYSGHGTRIPDESGDEKDGMDEVIIASDVVPIVDDLFDQA